MLVSEIKVLPEVRTEHANNGKQLCNRCVSTGVVNMYVAIFECAPWNDTVAVSAISSEHGIVPQPPVPRAISGLATQLVAGKHVGTFMHFEIPPPD